MHTEIRQIQEADAHSYRNCLDSVARERKYLAQVEALPIEKIKEFVASAVADDSAQYVAIADSLVVGWCDIFPHWAYALKHVGTLGMGVHKNHRNQGLGKKLIAATLEHALRNGIYRITLEARVDNIAAIKLYDRLGFKYETRTTAALKFDGVYYDGVQMSLLQGPASVA